jgi:hypothetical protein
MGGKALLEGVDSAKGLPLVLMGDLIELAQAKADVRAEVIKRTKEYFGDGVSDLTVAKYALICGELGVDGLGAVCYGFGHEDGNLGHRAKSETLTRHADLGLETLIAEVHEASEPEIRGLLYRCIYGALFPGTEETRERLRLFASERWLVEKGGGRSEGERDWSVLEGVLALMHATGLSGVGEKLVQAKKLAKVSGNDTEIDDLLAGDDEGLFGTVREDRARDWRGAAVYLGETFECAIL